MAAILAAAETFDSLHMLRPGSLLVAGPRSFFEASVRPNQPGESLPSHRQAPAPSSGQVDRGRIVGQSHLGGLRFRQSGASTNELSRWSPLPCATQWPCNAAAV